MRLEENPNTCHSLTSRPPCHRQRLPIASDPPLPPTSTYSQALSIADVHLQSRYEKEFEGVQDVFELQVLAHTQSPV